MTDEQLHTAAFVFLDEMRAWRKVSFLHGDCVVIRAETHEQTAFRDEFDAQAFIERRAAAALLKFYHQEQAA